MPFIEIILIAIGLAMDAFAVSLAAGGSGQARGPRAAFRLSFHFGLFQALMPVLGWYAGSRVAPFMASVDHWLAFLLLGFVGYRMIRPEAESSAGAKQDPSRGVTLVALSVATSIDALAVGFSLAMLNVAIWTPSIVIGVITAALSLVGLALGGRLGRSFGRRMEVAGGVLLVLIGLRILILHLAW